MCFTDVGYREPPPHLSPGSSLSAQDGFSNTFILKQYVFNIRNHFESVGSVNQPWPLIFPPLSVAFVTASCYMYGSFTSGCAHMMQAADSVIPCRAAL
ncbi:hypothetical protein FKM82_007721 [Ascaphus truei]